MIALVIIIIAVSVIATVVVTLSLTKTASEADRKCREYSYLKKEGQFAENREDREVINPQASQWD